VSQRISPTATRQYLNHSMAEYAWPTNQCINCRITLMHELWIWLHSRKIDGIMDLPTQLTDPCDGSLVFRFLHLHYQLSLRKQSII
jgi:hypothetical protein